jgi:hypothetical protein
MSQAELLLVAYSPRGYLAHGATRNESEMLGGVYWLRPLCEVVDLRATPLPWRPTVPDACPRCVREWWRTRRAAS